MKRTSSRFARIFHQPFVLKPHADKPNTYYRRYNPAFKPGVPFSDFYGRRYVAGVDGVIHKLEDDGVQPRLNCRERAERRFRASVAKLAV